MFKSVQGWLGAATAAAALLSSSAAAAAGPAARTEADYLKPDPPRRLALLIGNGSYPAAPLPAAPIDLPKMHDALSRAGFHVEAYSDAKTFAELVNDELVPFLNTVKPDDIVVIYYFGHGFAHGPDNFLVPVAASTSVNEADIYDVFLPERAIREMVAKRRPGIAFLFLDACRTTMQFQNPGAPPPLVAQAVPGAPPSGDMIVSFAAVYGSKAFAPEAGAASYYTDALAKLLDTPGQEFDELHRRLTQRVETDSASRQTPSLQTERKSLFYFRPTAEVEAQEAEVWRAALQEGTRDAVQEFLDFQRASPYARAAQRWLTDHPVQERRTFTQVHPLVAELSWDPTGQTVQLNKLSKSIGVSRTFRATAETPTSADETPNFAALLAMTPKAITTQAMRASKSAKTEGYTLTTPGVRAPAAKRAAGSFRIPYGSELEVEGVKGSVVTASVANASQSKVVILSALAKNAGTVPVGRSLGQAVLSPSKTLPSAVDEAQLKAFVTPFLAANHTIGWVSIATPHAKSAWAQGLAQLQARHAKYLLTTLGVPESKITTVENLDTGEDGVRLRVFGT